MYDWAELRHFRYLLTILEKQGFRVAAEELHTSQPNLTVQARQFQENASVRLFRKMKNGRIRPTEAGVAFIAMARSFLQTRDEIIDALIAIERGEINSLRFGCGPLVDPELFRRFCGKHKEILPRCSIRPTYGDTTHLAEEILAGTVDAAVVTLPLEHPDLRVELISRDRLVVCLRRDDPLARKTAIRPLELQANLTVLYHPLRHPEAHERLMEMLDGLGITIQDYSSASNPLEMQLLVRDGHGVTLLREGTVLDDELTTRPVVGVDWTVDTAVVCHKQRYPRTIPTLIRSLKRISNLVEGSQQLNHDPGSIKDPSDIPKRQPLPVASESVQLSLSLENF